MPTTLTAISALALSIFCYQPADDVIARLLAASKEKSPLGHMDSFDDLKLSPAQLAIAEKHIKEVKDYRSYHLLFVVKNTSEKAYEGLPTDAKIMILASSLREQVFLNDWSYLEKEECFDNRAGKALLGLGKAGIAHLEPMLKDSTPAPLFGSEEHTLSDLYGYRRKDFAYRYISLILNQEPDFSPYPKERDKAIDVLVKQLRKR
jgi:hypothetical protein